MSPIFQAVYTCETDTLKHAILFRSLVHVVGFNLALGELAEQDLVLLFRQIQHMVDALFRSAQQKRLYRFTQGTSTLVGEPYLRVIGIGVASLENTEKHNN